MEDHARVTGYGALTQRMIHMTRRPRVNGRLVRHAQSLHHRTQHDEQKWKEAQPI
jgi:hypothetical protein